MGGMGPVSVIRPFGLDPTPGEYVTGTSIAMFCHRRSGTTVNQPVQKWGFLRVRGPVGAHHGCSDCGASHDPRAPPQVPSLPTVVPTRSAGPLASTVLFGAGLKGIRRKPAIRCNPRPWCGAAVAVGTDFSARPRADPYVRHYRIRLLLQVLGVKAFVAASRTRANPNSPVKKALDTSKNMLCLNPPDNSRL